MALRIVFMGTPDFSVPTLNALAEVGHEIAACYTQPPRQAGRRGLKLVPSPVQKAAETRGIPVFTPLSLKSSDEQERFAAHKADVAVVIAYGLLLPKPILDAPAHGCFNGHASLLPRWRGAAPIQRAIMAGDKETGMMIMKMDEWLDTGNIAMTARVTINESMTAGDLHDELSQLGATLMVEAMAALEAGTLTLTPQGEEDVTYAAKISKQETRIDWSRPAGEVHRRIMGLSPFPGAWFELILGGNPVRVKVLASETAEGSAAPGMVLDAKLAIACGEGAIRVTRLQKAGSKAMDAGEFLRGTPVAAGDTVS